MRWCLHLAVIVSTMLLFVFVVAWPMSYRWALVGTTESTGIDIRYGRINVEHGWLWEYTDAPSLTFINSPKSRSGLNLFSLDRLGDRQWSVLGTKFYWTHDVTEMITATNPINAQNRRYAGWAVSVPLWQPALLSALLPMLWFFRWRKRSKPYRRKRGLCVKCGYDLRGGTSESASCPECGTTP